MSVVGMIFDVFNVKTKYEMCKSKFSSPKRTIESKHMSSLKYNK